MLVALIGLWTFGFCTVGRLAIASPSILKSYTYLATDFMLVLVVATGWAVILPKWWKAAALPVLLLGVWGNIEGWISEHGAGGLSIMDYHQLNGLELAACMIPFLIPFVLAYAARRLGYPKKSPNSAPPPAEPTVPAT
ncbi:MAG: hypothetical protein NTW19_20165 [Planctomycetota bacterium]|nr:hypothetical protein [Planctomycetota bacterium]